MENDLVERSVDFSYDAMTLACPHCSGRAEFTFLEYTEGASVLCSGCRLGVTSRDRIELLLADPHDPLLDAEKVSEFAWYHTTTHESWPPEGREDSDNAVHLGTYESAIENMVRGMAYQSRADKRFYLNRVRICVDAERVVQSVAQDPGAAFTGLVPLSIIRESDRDRDRTDSDLLVLRYLNQCEHPGRISLAVDPAAIVEVQTLPISLDRSAGKEAVAAQHAYELERNLADHLTWLISLVREIGP